MAPASLGCWVPGAYMRGPTLFGLRGMSRIRRFSTSLLRHIINGMVKITIGAIGTGWPRKAIAGEHVARAGLGWIGIAA